MLAAAMALAALGLATAEVPREDDREVAEAHKYCIVGAGPGGLQLAYFLQQAGRDYIVIERNASAGSFFETYPRHRTLISINKRFTGHEKDEPRRTREFDLRHDWNSLVHDDRLPRFTNFSSEFYPAADDLVRYLKKFAEVYQLHVRYGQEVVSLRRRASTQDGAPTDGPFTLRTTTADRLAKVFTCEVTIVATGIHTPIVPRWVGVEHLDRYDDMSVDPNDYVGRSVMVIGNGNSGFETAANLVDVANYIHMASRSAARLTIATHYVGDVRLTAKVGAVLEGYQLKSLVGFAENRFSPDRIYFDKDLADGRIRLKVRPNATNVASFDSDVYPLDRAYDNIFLCTGWKFDDSFFVSREDGGGGGSSSSGSGEVKSAMMPARLQSAGPVGDGENRTAGRVHRRPLPTNPPPPAEPPLAEGERGHGR